MAGTTSKKAKQIGVRFDDKQMAKLNRVFVLGRKRTLGEVDKSTMLRELIGIIPFKVLKEEDRRLLKDDDDDDDDDDEN